jgi:hypothetical protein
MTESGDAGSAAMSLAPELAADAVEFVARARAADPSPPAPTNISATMPKPNVNVSRSRMVIGRAVGTVSSSGPSIRRSTLRPASSGSSRFTGSSSPISPSAATASVAAAVMGLVVEAIRKIESRVTEGPPTASLPSASTCTWPPRATSATRPGTFSSPTWRSAAACSPFSPAAVRRAAEPIT